MSSACIRVCGLAHPNSSCQGSENAPGAGDGTTCLRPSNSSTPKARGECFSFRLDSGVENRGLPGVPNDVRDDEYLGYKLVTGAPTFCGGARESGFVLSLSPTGYTTWKLERRMERVHFGVFPFALRDSAQHRASWGREQDTGGGIEGTK